MDQPTQQNWYSSYGQAKLLMDQLQEQRSSDTLCDVILVVDATRIKAHRSVLSASCPYFQAMFTSAFSEANTKEVPIKGVDGGALKSIVEFFYTSKISIFEGNAEDILRAACLLQVQEVQKHCCTFLKSNLDPTNCVGIIYIADALYCQDLKDCALTFTTENFLAVTASEEFLIMEPSLLSDIVSKEDFYVKLEEDLYKLLIKWVKYDVLHRKSRLFQLMKNVRFPLLGLPFLSKTVECDNLIQENADCCELVAKAKTYLESIKERFGLCDTVVFAAGIRGAKAAVTDSFAMGDDWRMVTFSPYDPNGRLQSLTSTGDSVFAVFKNAQLSRGHCVRYTYGTGEWALVRDADNKPVFQSSDHGGLQEIVSVDGYVYFVPGKGATGIERYDPRTNTWAKFSHKNEFDSYQRLVAFQSSIYLFGTGVKGRSIRLYDTATHTSLRMSNIVPAGVKEIMCAAVFKDKIYLVCHVGNKLVVKGYNTTAPRKWSNCGHLCGSFFVPNTFQHRMCMIVCNGRLYAISGLDLEPKYEARVEVYNEARNEWTKCAGVNVPANCTFCVAVTDADRQDSTPRNTRVEPHLVRKDPRSAVEKGLGSDESGSLNLDSNEYSSSIENYDDSDEDNENEEHGFDNGNNFDFGDEYDYYAEFGDDDFDDADDADDFDDPDMFNDSDVVNWDN